MDRWEERITVDPEVLVGKPVIRGTRISVELVVEHLSHGWSIDEVLRAFPHISRDDVLACLARSARQ